METEGRKGAYYQGPSFDKVSHPCPRPVDINSEPQFDDCDFDQILEPKVEEVKKPEPVPAV